MRLTVSNSVSNEINSKPKKLDLHFESTMNRLLQAADMSYNMCLHSHAIALQSLKDYSQKCIMIFQRLQHVADAFILT